MDRFAHQYASNLASQPEGQPSDLDVAGRLTGSLKNLFQRHELLEAVIAGLDHADHPDRAGARLAAKPRDPNLRSFVRRIGHTTLNALRQW